MATAACYRHPRFAGEEEAGGRKFRQAHVIPSLGARAQHILPPGKGQAKGRNLQPQEVAWPAAQRRKAGRGGYEIHTELAQITQSQGRGGLPLNASPGGQFRLHGATV